ncbi:MAG: glycosyltransferase family 39 protein [Verrucomicrobiota bacterium]|nr:glycosyltransferase family 39 protein [Verrucomicrobiota bacterium]
MNAKTNLNSSPPAAWRILISLALARLVLHCATNWQYGFHRDELGLLDDARFLDWGYVSYPPFTAFIARLALILFGPSLVGVRFVAVLAQSIAMVFTGLMARELGGRKWAQAIAALAAAVSPMSVCMGTMLQYIALDYLWWVLAAYGVIRLLRTENPRWWLWIGAILGLGMMTKYTMIFFIAGIVAGVVLTPARRYLRSPWLWAGAALSVAIFLPNLIWQMRHDFVSLTFLQHIHERDVEIGRTGGYFVQQLLVSANLFTLPLWVAGLWFYFVLPAGPVERDSVERGEERRRQTPHQPPGSTESRPTSGSDRRYRALGWMFLVPLLLFFFAEGRFYYMAPAYPMLFAAGAVVWEQWLARRGSSGARVGRGATWTALGAGAAFSAITMLPLAPINSAGWRLTSKLHDNFTEQIGWPELAATVAGIYDALPETERKQTAILAGNYGEAGGINLYGRAHGLPEVISGINTYWWRGYGPEPPEVVILVGFSRASAERFADQVELAGQVTNLHGVRNEETKDHPDIFVCRGFKKSWPEFWRSFQRFG